MVALLVTTTKALQWVRKTLLGMVRLPMCTKCWDHNGDVYTMHADDGDQN